MKNKKNTIEFYALDSYSKEVAIPPTPASKMLPKNFLKLNPYLNQEKKFSITGGISNLTAKRCPPLLDSMSIGYLVPLWADILVEKTNNLDDPHYLSWKVSSDLVSRHTNEQAGDFDRNAAYSKTPWKWHTNWYIKTPPGWSCIITHPMGHGDLPFRTISAIVDTDVYKQEVAYPFWLLKDFEGVIEKGTPIAQIIPFKRQDWYSEIKELKENEFFYMKEKGFRSVINGNYLKNIRKDKKYL